MRLWTCQQCGTRYKWHKVKPAVTARACVFYGTYGRPPFAAEGFNNAPLMAKFNYCGNCV